MCERHWHSGIPRSDMYAVDQCLGAIWFDVDQFNYNEPVRFEIVL